MTYGFQPSNSILKFS